MNAQLKPEEIAKIKDRLKDREWRLDNLYYVRDEQGNIVKFKPYPAQRDLSKRLWSRNLIPKARKIGFSTFIGILICDACVFRSGTVAGIIDLTLDDAKSKLDIVKLAYEKLPAEIRAARPLLRDNQDELVFSNRSKITVGTTYRGDTPSILHVSEYGKISVDSPEVAREIKTGGIQAVPMSGVVFIESTAHGTSGDFCDMVRTSQARMAQGATLTGLDFRTHFYGWHWKPEYRLPNNLVIIPQELKEYFAEIKARYGVNIDADQMAFYTKKYEELGPDDIRSEFPSHSDELFYNSLQGAYWRREMTKARQEGRIGQMVQHDPTRRVNTFWDIGEDCTAIWFHQTDGVRHRFIDYWEEEGGSLQSAAAVVEEKGRTRRFIYEKHYGPHDLENRDWANSANTRIKTAEGLGVKFTVVPRVSVKADAIEAARRMISMSWFDAEHCARGVECLDNYRKRWNERLGSFTAEPMHDWASHGSDAIQQGAMGLTPDKPKRERRYGTFDQPRVSQWSA